MIYRVTHPDRPGEQVRVQLTENGELLQLYAKGRASLEALLPYITVDLPFAPVRKNASTAMMTWSNELRRELRDAGFTVTSVKEDLSVNQKVGIWCKLWLEYKGHAWVMQPADVGKLKALKVDEPLLRWYLNDKDMPDTTATYLWRGKQSIANLAFRINEVRAAMTAKPKSKHPDHWSEKHLSTLTGPEVGDYHRHLKGIGLVPKYNRNVLVDYVRPDGKA